MKALLSFLLPLALLACGPQPTRKSEGDPASGPQPIMKGEADLIWYRKSPTSAKAWASQEYKGEDMLPGTSLTKWRTPFVAVYDNYLSISFPGTNSQQTGIPHEIIIPRESLIELQWK